MAQFDVYENERENRELFPYLLDITHGIHVSSKLRVVVPLCSDSHAIGQLNPLFHIDGQALYMSTMDMAGIPAVLLGTPLLNLEEKRNEIVDAVDFLINGF